MTSRAALSAESRESLAALAESAAAFAVSMAAAPEHAKPLGPDPSGSPDPMLDVADACLDAIADVARFEARFAALKVLLAAEFVHAAGALAPPARSAQEGAAQEMAVVAEIACALTVSEGTAAALLSESRALTTALPQTLAALQAGTISWQHARIVVDETAHLDAAGAAGLEEHFLDAEAAKPARGCPAGELVPGRFRAKVRAWRERHHPVSIEKRHAKSAEDRRVEFVPDRDGMAWLSTYLPAATAAGIWERTTAAARSLQGPSEARTLTQLRADVAATWLLTTGTDIAGAGDGAGAGDVPSPRAQVLITVPVLSLLGATEEPATLDGYGPIPPSMARRLIAEGAGSFHRVLIDPRDGAPLEIGRTSYRLTGPQRQWLRLRDGKCPFPGCNNASLDNEADHLLAWADGGTTGISNLGQPCRKHHRLKHTSAWTPTRASNDHPPGWTSPMGRRYASESQDWEPPRWPGLVLAQDLLFDVESPPDQEPEFDADLPPDEGTGQDFDLDLPKNLSRTCSRLRRRAAKCPAPPARRRGLSGRAQYL